MFAPATPALPPFIPVLPRGLPRGTKIPREMLLGVSFSSAFLPSGRVRFLTPTDMRRDLQLDDDARMCLLGTGSDELLERVWQNSEKLKTWDAIARLSFEFSTTFTFSVWERQPRFDQIFNQDRNLYTFSRLTSLGIPTVPFLFCADSADRKAALSWLEVHPEVYVVALLAQFFRKADALVRILDEMRTTRAKARRHIRFLLVGCATSEKITKVFREFPDTTIVTSKPVHKAIAGCETLPDLSHRQANRKITRNELVAGNLSLFNDFIDAARC
jgi:hypothetical protein